VTSDAEHLPRRVGLLGAGVIGSGWAARFLLAGVDVCLFDPAPGSGDTALAALERARRAWRHLTLVPPPPEGRLTLAATIKEAVAGAELVQESAPEREVLKAELLREADAVAAPDTIIASSTSGLLPSRLVRSMIRPERFVVGHPFNPVYLLPLVEVCGADESAPETVRRAAAIYRGCGMRPLVVRREIDGFIADRLLEALWREALWLVADDVATVEEVDDAIRFGAGLRWSAMGTFLTYRLAGGEAGMRHFMAQFGPALQLPWTRLTDVPDLDQELLDKLVAQSDAQAAGRSIAELERLRDDCLVAVLSGLRSQGFGAGETVAQTERRWLARGPAAADRGPAQSPLRLHTALVTPDWIDYNGHMTEFRYLQVLADTTDAFLAHIGIDAASAAAGSSYYTVESHLRHLGQAYAGDRLVTTTQLLGHDAKRLHLFHEVHRHSAHGDAVASGEHMLIHVDAATGRSAPAGPAVLAALERIAARSGDQPVPAGAGRRIDVVAA
jgi:carnitine 3-dehydrogenase / betainyl-CoA thioesterase